MTRNQKKIGLFLAVIALLCIAATVTPRFEVSSPSLTEPSSAVEPALVIDLTNSNFENEVKSSSGLVVVDVYATWCFPCKKQMPIFLKLSEEFKGKVGFAKLDVDAAKSLAKELEISSMPTMLFFKDGKLVERHTGLVDQSALRSKIAGHCK